MTPSLFAANYELKNIANSEALFTNPNFTNESQNIYNGICHIDASYGGSDGTGFSIVKEKDGKFFVFRKRFKKHVDDCLNEIIELIRFYKGVKFIAKKTQIKAILQRN